MNEGRLFSNRYRVLERVGRGGMAEVYRGEDTREDREVAIKVVLPELIPDEHRRRRFLREARTLSKLSHPSIVRVYDWGEEPDRTVWIAMEFIDGVSLGAVLDRGPLPLAEVVSIVAPVARALGVAHREGFVHRDVKPENILLRTAGPPVLVDFGITRSIAYETPARSETREKLTRTGMLVGTPEYMSPEQIRSGTLDGRSDLFSLAVVTYEALTGARPFLGEAPMSVIASVLTDPVLPLASLVDGVPRELEETVLKALNKDPAERPADIDVFATMLETFAPTSLGSVDLNRLVVRCSDHPLRGLPTVLDLGTPDRARAETSPTWAGAEPGAEPSASVQVEPDLEFDLTGALRVMQADTASRYLAMGPIAPLPPSADETSVARALRLSEQPTMAFPVQRGAVKTPASRGRWSLPALPRGGASASRSVPGGVVPEARETPADLLPVGWAVLALLIFGSLTLVALLR
ncbi:MAG: serine/threonine protein kinase [Myxococcales bacterium]|nr:serine/threonine protein kinase [Myxococcales bacterium]